MRFICTNVSVNPLDRHTSYGSTDNLSDYGNDKNFFEKICMIEKGYDGIKIDSL